ncbi:MAG: aminoglycoside 6-adenylyltransferase [Clostridia bacterium]|nr:aminoglycoside 6-adenylyltransferase [Clostridia bacterium]
MMRTEREILETVMDAARRDSSVRAVIRTDLVPVRKYLYTFNFCFVVNDIERFDEDVFRTCFGDRILLFRGDRNYPEMFPGVKAHLMVFRDGVTLVIHAMGIDAFLARFDRKSASGNVWIGDTYQKLLDKDHILPEIERPEEKQTIFAGVPTAEEFDSINREFWWVMKTFAEYTLREELPAAMFYLNNAVRDLLNRMIRWYVFLKAGHPVDLGILDSRMGEVLDADLFRLYKKTYPGADDSQIWEAFDAAKELWRETGLFVSACCGYDYPAGTESDMAGFIRRLREQKTNV